MKIKTKSFAKAVLWLSGIASSEADKLTVKTQDKKGYIYLMETRAFAKAPFDIVSGDENMEFTVQLRYIKALAKILNGASVDSDECSLEKRATGLTIKTSNSKHSCPTYNGTVVEPKDIEKIGTADHLDFFSLLEKSSLLVSSDTVVKSISAINVEFLNNKIRVVSTNQAALGQFEISAETHLEEDESYLLPSWVASIEKGISRPEENVTFVKDNATNRFGFQFDDQRMVVLSTVMDKYVDYRAIVESASDSVDKYFVIDRKELMDTIKNITSLVNESVLTIASPDKENKKIVISDQYKANVVNIDVPETNSEESSAIKVVKDSTLLSLRSLDGDKVKMSYSSTGSKFILINSLLGDGKIDPDSLVILAMGR